MNKLRTLSLVALSLVIVLAVALPSGVNAEPGDGVRSFHGKWVSVRIGIPQTLKIRCDAETNYCKMRLVVEESRTCTDQFGEPTGALLEGEGQVEVIDQTIEIVVDAYCLTKPPTYSFSFPVTFTYNELDDTLADNLGVIWYRK